MSLASLVVLTLVVMLVGLLGTLVPGIPGIPLIWLALAGFEVFDRFQHLSIPAFLLLTAVALVGTTAEVWGTRLFVHATGGSGWTAAAGSCLAVIGLLFFTLPMALVIALAGVFGLEWRRRKSACGAALSSAGWLAGWALSLVVQLTTAIVIILLFVQWVAG